MKFSDRLKGCLVGGAIGDGLGSAFEGQVPGSSIDLDVPWAITDDTQLTMATCEALIESKRPAPEKMAAIFLEWYNGRRLTGLGSSTLKALRDLQIGAHWWLAGRSGEYGAGNGAAMRIAPLAFFLSPDEDRALIRDICSITHKNDEAYVGCLCLLYALTYIIQGKWDETSSLIELITPHIPDTATRDNLLRLQDKPELTIKEAADLVGCSGHVVQSIPFVISAAQKIRSKSFTSILIEIILCGGDTDTNASMAGQIIGAYHGYSGLSDDLLSRFKKIRESAYILETAERLVLEHQFP
jgi:ADP-ribosyl-[dinitrogen reductase] hydrolase